MLVMRRPPREGFATIHLVLLGGASKNEAGARLRSEFKRFLAFVYFV